MAALLHPLESKGQKVGSRVGKSQKVPPVKAPRSEPRSLDASVTLREKEKATTSKSKGDCKESLPSKRSITKTQLAKLPTAQFRLNLAPFRDPLPINPFPPPSSATAIDDIGALKHTSPRVHAPVTLAEAFHLASSALETAATLRAAAAVPVASATPIRDADIAKDEKPTHAPLKSRTTALESGSARLRAIGGILDTIPRLLEAHATKALNLGKWWDEDTSDSRLDTPSPGLYLPRRARLEREVCDATGTIQLYGHRAVTLRRPGVYELAYRIPTFFVLPYGLDSVGPGVPGITAGILPGRFAILAMAIFVKEGDRAVVLPRSLTLLLPHSLGHIPPLVTADPFEFRFVSNLFEYPSATVRHRTCTPCSRTGVVAALFSNVPATVPAPGGLTLATAPIITDFNGLFAATRLQ